MMPMADTIVRPRPPDVDGASLRRTLDQLHAALYAPGDGEAVQAAGSRALHDGRILDSLREVVSALDRANLTGPVDRSDNAAILGGPSGLQRLRVTLSNLQPALKAYVWDKLGEREIERLRDFLDAPGPDLLHLVDKAGDENSHSHTLRWLLDPRTAPGIAPTALSRLTEILPHPDIWKDAIAAAASGNFLSVRREYVIGAEWADFGRDRIDIVISGGDFVIAIENKLWSTEHDDQTVTYWKWLKELPGLKAGIYLTPSGMPATCPEFRPVSYLELLGWLLAGADEQQATPTELVVLSAYTKTLARWVLRAEVRAVVQSRGGI